MNDQTGPADDDTRFEVRQLRKDFDSYRHEQRAHNDVVMTLLDGRPEKRDSGIVVRMDRLERRAKSWAWVAMTSGAAAIGLMAKEALEVFRHSNQ